MCLTFQILSSEIQRGLFIKSASQSPSYMKFREQFLLLCINVSLIFSPWKNLPPIQTLPFTDKKGVSGCVSYTGPCTQMCVCVCVCGVCTERDALAAVGALHKIWNISCKSRREKSMLLISSFVLPSSCLCPFLPQAACNSSQVSEGLTLTFCSPQNQELMHLHSSTITASLVLVSQLEAYHGNQQVKVWAEAGKCIIPWCPVFQSLLVTGGTLCLVFPPTDLKLTKYLHTYVWVFPLPHPFCTCA